MTRESIKSIREASNALDCVGDHEVDSNWIACRLQESEHQIMGGSGQKEIVTNSEWHRIFPKKPTKKEWVSEWISIYSIIKCGNLLLMLLHNINYHNRMITINVLNFVTPKYKLLH